MSASVLLFSSAVHVTVESSGLMFVVSFSTLPSSTSAGASLEVPLVVPLAPPFLTIVGCFLRSSSASYELTLCMNISLILIGNPLYLYIY